jgi:acyl-CoA thioester hydrolase
VTHRLEVRVYYEDTDAGGVVYHAGYLRFAERARTELLRAAGLDHRTLLERAGGQLVVRRLEADFLAPARLDDLLAVETRPLATTGARVALEQTVRRGDTLLVRLAVEIAFVGRDGRPRRLPEALRRVLAPTDAARPARLRP